jgi:hypothetical protein
VKPRKISAEDIRHELNHLRTAMKEHGYEVPRRSLHFPLFRLRMRD